MSLSSKLTAAPAAPLSTGISSLADLIKKRHIIADIYTECTKFYSMLLKRASGNRDIPPHIYRGLESSYSSLVLWGQGYGVADGNLDDLLKKSKLLQSITLEPLIRISEILRNRLHPYLASRMNKSDSYPKYTLFVLINEAKKRLRAIQSGLRDLNGEDIASFLETINLQDEDSLEDIMADIKTDTQCLIDLDPMYEYPVNDEESQTADRCEAAAPSLNWRHQYVETIYQLFPLAGQDLIQQLGWYLNGRIDMRRREYNPSSKIMLQSLIEEDIYETLALYFNFWILHNNLNSSCPLCCESVEYTNFFGTHLSQHAEEIYLQVYHPGLNKTNEKTSTDLNLTEKKPTKPFSKDLIQTIKDNKASTFTKHDLLLHDNTREESEDEHGLKSTSESNWKVTMKVPTAKSSTTTRSPRLHCHLCSKAPEGFRREYELLRHIRLVHINKQQSDHGAGDKASEKISRDDTDGGNHVPMDVLKQWMEEKEERVDAAVDADTDTGQSSQDEDPPRKTSSTYSAPVGGRSDRLDSEDNKRREVEEFFEKAIAEQALIAEEIGRLTETGAKLTAVLKELSSAPVRIQTERDIELIVAKKKRIEEEIGRLTEDGARLTAVLKELSSAPLRITTEREIESIIAEQRRIKEGIGRLTEEEARLRAQLNKSGSTSVK